MNRLILLAFCMLLGNQGKSGPDALSPEIPARGFPKIDERPLQSILKWDFGQWHQVDSQPKSVDTQFSDLCIENPYQGMRSSEGYPEDNPHRIDLIQIRVNDAGLTAYRLGTPAPVGTVVIKEKHRVWNTDEFVTFDRPFAVAAMIKREPGYDPEHGDWEYAFQVNLPVKDKSLIQGKLAACIGCHQNVRDQDYLFRNHLGKQE